MKVLSKIISIRIAGALFLICILWIFLNAVLAAKEVKAVNQKQIILPNLTINDQNLVLILDSLVASENKCDDFDNSLIWILSISEERRDTYRIEVTMVSGFDVLINPSLPQPHGYFYLDQTLFVVIGEQNGSLFTMGEKSKRFCFEEMELLQPEDYSVWFYEYKDGKFTLEEAYTLPCP